MTKPWYDDLEHIEEHVKTLDGFHVLRKGRREAGDVREEKLRSWIIIGKWSFDGCGNMGKIKEVAVKRGEEWDKSPHLKHVLPGVPDVFENIDGGPVSLLGEHSWITSSGVTMPESSDSCQLCGKGWRDPDDAWEAEHINDRFWHKRCWVIDLRRKERDFFSEIMQEAGVSNPLMNEYPNGYWTDSPKPWFLVSFPFGDIKIGWRKSVIAMSWEKPVPDVLFSKEHVTKSETGIHAHGKDKAVEYLKTLIPVLGMSDQELSEYFVCKEVTNT